MMLGLLIIYTFVSNIPVIYTFNPVVSTSLGDIEGLTRLSLNGSTYYAFEGVPYGKPPVGRRRFESPLPVKPWIGIWKAQMVTKCAQYRHLAEPEGKELIIGHEDCLYLNIYTPSLEKDANLDVIVYIHGGAFSFNYGAFQGADFLLNNRLVFVNFNYRVGPLGFLSTEDAVIPGNNGLKDQILALKWVKRNIKYFGGNPSSITLAGNSAGGASVHLHYLIRRSRGLFHKGISQSGVALSPWTLMENPLEKTKIIAANAGCSTVDSRSIRDCLKTRPVMQILESVKLLQPWLYNPWTPFGVVVDKWALDPLLSDHPYELLKRKNLYNVPWMVSHTNAEGLYPAAELYQIGNRLEELDSRWNEILPHILDFNFTVDSNSSNSTCEKIRKFYLQDQKLSQKSFPELVQVFSDRLFISDIYKSARLHAAVSKAPVYYYYFAYRGTYSRSMLRAKCNDNFGASHFDDGSYIMKTNLDTQSTESDRAMSKLLIGVWRSMANAGKPEVGVEWPAVSKNPSENPVYLKIDSPENFTIETTPLGHTEFWDSLPINENERLQSIKIE